MEEDNYPELTESRKAMYNRWQSEAGQPPLFKMNESLLTLPEIRQKQQLLKRIKNSIWGFILGDCTGVPYEFMEAGTFTFEPMKGFGTHNQPPMTYSDDTAMMLSFMDSFDGRLFDIDAQKRNLKRFLEGEYSVDGVLFDVGNATRQAIQTNFSADTSQQYGNGGLLRCWLFGLWELFGLFDQEDCRANVLDSLRLTHSTQEKYFLVFREYCRIWKFHLLGKDEIPFDLPTLSLCTPDNEGTIFNAFLTIAYALVARLDIVGVIEQGGDTDSNAALFGALFCARPDMAAPEELKKTIRNYAYLEEKIGDFISKINLSETFDWEKLIKHGHHSLDQQ